MHLPYQKHAMPCLFSKKKAFYSQFGMAFITGFHKVKGKIERKLLHKVARLMPTTTVKFWDMNHRPAMPLP